MKLLASWLCSNIGVEGLNGNINNFIFTAHMNYYGYNTGILYVD